MDWVALILYLFVGFLFLLQVVFRVARRWLKFPTPGILTQVIDNPFRRRFIQNPDTIADRMELEPGMTVVEVGPGKGSYTFAVARRVDPGTVYACDIQPGVVERLRERAAREGVANVDARFEDAYGFSFGGGTGERGLMSGWLPQI